MQKELDVNINIFNICDFALYKYIIFCWGKTPQFT